MSHAESSFSSDDELQQTREPEKLKPKKRKSPSVAAPSTSTERPVKMAHHGNAESLFPTDDELRQPREPEKLKLKKKKPSSGAAPSTSRESQTITHAPSLAKSKKPVIKPIAPKKATAHDIFGTDSDDDAQDQQIGGKPIHPLQSYMSRRVANGHSRQTFDFKKGTHFVELKVYSCDEIQHVAPMNRWRHAIICIKNRTDENTDSWQHLSNFITATRKEFKGCPVSFVSNYYSLPILK